MSQVKAKMSKIEQLQKETEEHNLRTTKLDKLKDAYAKFETGELDRDQFKYIVMTDIGAKDTGNLKRILASSQLDKKSFHEILKNTDIIKHKEVEEKKNSHYDPKYHSAKRVLAQPKSHESPLESNYHLKQGTMKLISNKMTPDDYRELLKQEGINPNIEGINKFIRAKEEGNPVSYKDLVVNINTHKGDSLDPTKVHIEKGKDCRFREDTGKESSEKLMMSTKDNFVVYGSKKQVDSDVNAFKSQKDVFDWDMHMLKSAEKEKNAKKGMTYDKSLTQKNLYSSNVFNEQRAHQANSDTTGAKKSKRQYKGGSDIFHLTPQEQAQHGRNRGLNRLNKNSETVIKEQVVVKPLPKKNTFQQVSEDNTLFKKVSTNENFKH